ncbi:MAG: type II secretion system F family protein [Candidatus Omnitrophica bacterium]|nr:type II secretion system F family protein [Candidatus Omnitrophota bacterium]
MGVYSYKAVDSRGKSVKGTLDAANETDVSTQIAKLGYLPVSISYKGEKGVSILDKFTKGRVKKASMKAVIVFTRQFATVIKAAVPIVEGLGVLAEQAEDAALKGALHQIIHDIEEGSKLSESMAKHPGVFSDLYVSTVIAGEAGGVLDKILLRLSEVLEEERETRSSIKAALQYPVMVVVALFIAVFVLSVFVVPQFTKIYIGMKMELPLPTRVMILVSKGFKNYWFITFPSFVGIIFSLKFFINTPGGRKIWDNFKFNMPVFGKVYNKIVMLRFASMLNVLYQAGLPILKILDIVKVTIGNVVLAKDIDRIKIDVADGKGVSGGILASKLFPRLVGYMIAIGEKAGALSAMLDSLCDYYTMEVRNAMGGLTALIEPIMTAVLGSVVMGMALAIFLPMWSLIGAMK